MMRSAFQSIPPSRKVRTGWITMGQCFVWLAVFSIAVVIAWPLGSRMLQPHSPESKSPRVEIAQWVRDIGQVNFREQRDHCFAVHNSGNGRLSVYEIDVDCACGTPILRSYIVPAGETVQVPVSLDSRYATGTVETTATFRCNDPNRSQFRLTVRGKLNPLMNSDQPTPAANTDPTSANQESASGSVLLRGD